MALQRSGTWARRTLAKSFCKPCEVYSRGGRRSSSKYLRFLAKPALAATALKPTETSREATWLYSPLRLYRDGCSCSPALLPALVLQEPVAEPCGATQVPSHQGPSPLPHTTSSSLQLGPTTDPEQSITPQAICRGTQPLPATRGPLCHLFRERSVGGRAVGPPQAWQQRGLAATGVVVSSLVWAVQQAKGCLNSLSLCYATCLPPWAFCALVCVFVGRLTLLGQQVSLVEEDTVCLGTGLSAPH